MFLRSVMVRLSSSLTRRIVVLNLGGLLALLLLFLYINQFREGLIDARVQSLQSQGESMAVAIAALGSVGVDATPVDPEKLLQAPGGQANIAPDDEAQTLEFSINPERIGPVLRRLVSPTGTRARIYGRDGELILDSGLLTQDAIRRPSTENPAVEGLMARVWSEFRQRFARPAMAPSEMVRDRARGGSPEVVQALAGGTQSSVQLNIRGATIISVATPIHYDQSVRGALLLTTQPGDIDKIIASERWGILRVFLVAAGVMFVLSLFLAGTIAGPMRRLAEAAERVRRGVNSREEIPDFSSRADEIGHLSRALRDMTKALYSRMEATESFAADVAHELKNPLTSLRSAVETLPRIKAEESRDRLMSIIQHDIRRLDRLISDISDASRLDAELARGKTATVDVAALLAAVVSVASEVERGDGVTFDLRIAHRPNHNDVGPNRSKVINVTDAKRPEHDAGRKPVSTPRQLAMADFGKSLPIIYGVDGNDSRLGQVFNNLIDNARSFSARGGVVRIDLRPAHPPGHEDEDQGNGLEVIIDDDGPGVPAHAFERIFERFYTDRPEQGFGQNSGLGLSISRQIIEAHGGKIWAANRLEPREGGDEALDHNGRGSAEEHVLGARFTVWLPLSRR